MPIFQISYLAILLAVIANFFLSFIWYTLLFRNAWAREMGFDLNEKPASGAMLKGMSLSILGSFLLAWVLSHNIAAWNPISWGLPPTGPGPFASAMLAAVFTWLGFYVPVILNTVAWEKKSWKLFGINAAYHLVSLMVIANIITHVRT